MTKNGARERGNEILFPFHLFKDQPSSSKLTFSSHK